MLDALIGLGVGCLVTWLFMQHRTGWLRRRAEYWQRRWWAQVILSKGRLGAEDWAMQERTRLEVTDGGA